MSDNGTEPEVWAAGGVVEDDEGRLLVGHRPRYDDWTFPKGKLDPGETLEEFTDIRDLQRSLKASGVTLLSEADETSTGPASFMVVDPDGNPVLIDQHV